MHINPHLQTVTRLSFSLIPAENEILKNTFPLDYYPRQMGGMLSLLETPPTTLARNNTFSWVEHSHSLLPAHKAPFGFLILFERTRLTEIMTTSTIVSKNLTSVILNIGNKKELIIPYYFQGVSDLWVMGIYGD